MTATMQFVQETFDRFNALCFNGVLPPVPIVMSRAGSFLGKVEYRGVRGLFGLVTSNTGFRLKISTRFDLPVEDLEDVVLHEMIHYYIAWKNMRDSSVHGKMFRNIMQQINSRYGRHVTISHRTRPGQKLAGGSPSRIRELCVSTFTDGRRGVTVAARGKAPVLHRIFTGSPDISSVQWYLSSDPFFERFPRSRTPKVYRVDPVELEEHLKGTEALTDARFGGRKRPEGDL